MAIPGNLIDDVISDDELYNNDDDDEETPLTGQNEPMEETKGWDKFRVVPVKDMTGSLANKDWVLMWSKAFKFTSYVLSFLLLLAAAVLSKGLLLFMTSQLKPNITHPYCPYDYGAGKSVEAEISAPERVAWIWALVFSFVVPEFFMWFRSTRIGLFRKWEAPATSHFLVVLLFDTLHVAGLVALVFAALPFFEVVQGAMITNCVCLVPAVLGLMSRSSSESRRGLKSFVDVLAILCQLSGCFAWAVMTWTGMAADEPRRNLVWILPVALICTSFGWWENYVHKDSPLGVVRYLAGIKKDLKKTRYFAYFFVTLWRVLVFLAGVVVIEWSWSQYAADPAKRGDVSHLFQLFGQGFGEHEIVIKEVPPFGNKPVGVADAWPNTQAIVFGIQAGASFLCFLVCKFACKICIQGFGFALPVNLSVPVVIAVLVGLCDLKAANPCAFSEPAMPGYLFWNCPSGSFLNEILTDQMAWLWLVWLLSQGWITLHIWRPRCERLATTEKLFAHAFYNSLLVDQSLAMNRRRDDDDDVAQKLELTPDQLAQDGDMTDLYERRSVDSVTGSVADGVRVGKVRASDTVTRIYVCATMWHETQDEIVTFLKSIFYLDQDQSARRLAQKYLNIVDPDYYELETHIFFDDAFEMSDDDEDEVVVNRFVRILVNSMDEAASFVHQVITKVRPPTRIPTPYGGRLVWTLPGKTKIICHLKDKSKIRHKKRWSQCMYMYYLLGHKLMDLDISIERKTTIADNTYLLALDGDIDFTPDAVQMLVDLMKKNRNVGAACGRIHPVGSGLMAWYQRFEYAIGHWLQKATEHMVGCVLCSPGCFSLFRGRALMEDNIMAKYTTLSTEARHYVQYDQGEDRWLCTLMLQRGFRVEYSAASDAYTHCPEGFGEFFNQRRRWVPSTMANIFDLLLDYKRTVAINENISMLYIFYQALMMFGTVIGPGTIFLMIVGSVNSAFKIDQLTSFVLNLIPIVLFIVVCLTTKSSTQIVVAELLSILYAIIMMAVLVGIILELSAEGLLSPSGIFLMMMAFSFIIAAIVHPQEFWCLPYGLVYYLTVPSMYLLLIIYSLSNLNNVSWGTREVVAKKKKPTPQELEAEKKKAEAAKKAAKQGGFFSKFMNNVQQDDDEGSLEFSMAGLFKIMCCVHKKPQESMRQLSSIADSLESLKRRLDSFERLLDPTGSALRRRGSVSRSSVAGGSVAGGLAGGNGAGSAGAASVVLASLNEQDEDDFDDELDSQDDQRTASEVMTVERDDNIAPYWMMDKELKRGGVDFLGAHEIQFFNELIEKYLRPIDKDEAKEKRAENDLLELRNNAVSAFYIINALYITAVFLLTLEKENVYLRWPFGEIYEITYTYRQYELTGEVQFDTTFLKLEPIGFVSVLLFGSILIIQFVAMLFHRFGTLSHILASTDVSLFTRKMEDLSEDAILEQSGVAIARELQKLRGIDEDDDDDDDDDALQTKDGRRRTLAYLEKSSTKKPGAATNLDMAFRKRLMSIGLDGGPDESGSVSAMGRRMTIRRDTLKLLGRRRSTVVAEMRRRSSVHLTARGGSISSGHRDSFATASNDHYD